MTLDTNRGASEPAAGQRPEGEAAVFARSTPRSHSTRALTQHVGLVVLLLLGAALRSWATLAYRPAVLGYPDGTEYLINGVSDLWRNIGRPLGYPLLIRAVTSLGGGLTALITVQHLLGMATAVLLYVITWRVSRSALVACVPAAAILLSGDQVYIEHSPMSEPLFAFLVALAIAFSLRAVADDGRDRFRGLLRWCAVAGGVAGAAATVRYVGEALIPVLALWMVVFARGSFRTRLAAGVVVCVAAGAVIGGYVVLRTIGSQSSGGTHGQTGLAVPGNAMYGRVAPFADCRRFTPPPGTKPLCDRTPPSERNGPGWYVFSGSSPFHRAPLDARLKVDAFARTALLHQPDGYLLAVARDVGRYVAPSALARAGIGWGDKPSAYRFERPRAEERRAIAVANELFGPTRVHRRATVATLDRYQAIVRFHGGLVAVCALLGVCGVLVGPRPVRAAVLLMLAIALTALAVPVAVASYDARYAFPVEGLIAAAGALGAWSLAARLRPTSSL